jgi:Xaa-Pro aminopeptidase
VSRIDALRAKLEEPLLVTNLVNVLYLCGFDSSNAALLVEQDRVRLFTDFRYIESARAVHGVEAVQTKRAVIAELAGVLSGRIGFETILPFAQHETLREGGIELVPRSGLVESLRAVKDDTELELIRTACKVTDRALERLLDVPFVGRTERDVSWDFAQLFHEEGAEAPAFEFIVGSGPTGSHPHARAGDRKIGAGELVVIDCGCNVGGYSSDCTRTLATGPVDGRMREAYEVVRLAQDAALGGIRAGLTGVEADALARDVIDASEFKGSMGHGLGHGLGLEVHEDPRLSTESRDVLAPGNVVTVEPGIYVANDFGIRIEDDVVVTAEGIENLTGFRKDLTEVG